MKQSQVNAAVKRALRDSHELKQGNFEGTFTVPGNAAIRSITNVISGGSSFDQRVGNVIHMRDAEISYSVAANSAGGIQFVRVMLVCSLNAESLLSTDILTSDNFNSTYSNQQKTTGKIKVLYDKMHTLYDDKPAEHVHRTVKIGRNAHWSSSISDLSTQTGGSLSWVTLSNNDIDRPAMTANIALHYTDS
jgi:hypothetical protein